MTLTSAESDWNGFLKSVSLRMPHVDLRAAPAAEQGLDAFCDHLALVGEITLAEAEDLVLTLLLPAWLDRRTMIAAE
jgi:hypothetical protein